MKLKQSGKLAPANKPWDLINDAIDDLTLQERTKLVKIDMDAWHIGVLDSYSYYYGTKCKQCLAGSVMSRRLNVDLDETKEPDDFPIDIELRLTAIDYFREGCINAAYDILGLAHPKYLPDTCTITSYQENKTQFKKDMRDLAAHLKYLHSGKAAKYAKTTY